MNILIPMAGAGSRFERAGYSFPKPLISIKNFNDKPMIQVVIENINIYGNYIFLIRKEHDEKYNLKHLLSTIVPECKVIVIDKLTDGAACTVLLAKNFIDNNEPLLIANSDQYIMWNKSEFQSSMQNPNIDGGILVFNNSHPKWSYAKIGKDGFIENVAEKNPISQWATCGIYYWKQGRDCVTSIESMISKNIKTNDEFYLCPSYNELINNGKKIAPFKIEKMFGIGTPEDLQWFENNFHLNKA